MKPLLSPLCPLVGLVLLTTACANTQMGRTGFLDDYESLQPAPERHVWGVPDEIDLWVHPQLAEREYDAVVIDDVVYQPHDGESVLDDDEREHLTDGFKMRLARELGESFEVLEAPRAGAVRVRAAIVDVNHSRPWLNIIGVILLVPPDMGGIAAEMEVLDATSGERLVAMTATRDGTPFLLWETFFTWGHARHGMYKWGVELREILGGDEPVETGE